MDKLTHDETLLLLDALSSVLPNNFSSAQMQKRAERKLKRWLDHKDIEFAWVWFVFQKQAVKQVKFF